MAIADWLAVTAAHRRRRFRRCRRRRFRRLPKSIEYSISPGALSIRALLSELVRELEDQPTCPFGQLGRDLDDDFDQLVPPSVAVGMRYALAPHAQNCIRRHAFWDPEHGLPVDGSHTDLGAKGSLRERDRHPAKQVIAVTREELVGCNLDFEDERPR